MRKSEKKSRDDVKEQTLKEGKDESVKGGKRNSDESEFENRRG